ncbi:transporter [Pontibacter vulgaris]|uniref:transporter n=1 Tax=Pontibacter vulgaris TaxID=2905679 RepID=UPI001FA7369F|nr:transporter [Pontibacter vulgaris]
MFGKLNWHQLFVIIGFTTLLPYCAQAQEKQKLESDRPDQGVSSTVVPKQSLQIEAGWLYQKDKAGEVTLKTIAYPSVLLRYGLLHKLELRLQTALKDSVIERSTEKRIKGIAPVSVGAKASLWKGQGLLPEGAFIFMITLPVGSKALRPDNPEPQLRLSFTNKLADKTDFNYNLVQSWVSGISNTGYTAALSQDFTDKFTVYAEVFGNKPKGETAAHQADGGLLFLLRDNLQLDVAAGTKLTSAAPDYFITAGISARLPE